MEFVIVTGMLGAGKTSALHVLEDLGYYCVDNIPAALLDTLYILCENTKNDLMSRVAVVIDVRSNQNYQTMVWQLEGFKRNHKEIKILFIDAKSDQIIVRYKETRRRHPLADRMKDGSLAEAVEFEKFLMEPIKRIADYTIDTTLMSNKQLRERVTAMFMGDTLQGITLTFMSFGFKYGIPAEADTILDVRCLPNPFYVPELKNLTGLDEAVRDYVLGSEETREFIEHTIGLFDFAVPLYSKEGKSELVVGIGCTGGKHRSVTIVRELNRHYEQRGYRCVIQHRDVSKE
ncbi:MAG: RNase adapter RapZ [Ruminococcus sp.]|nr:RNase adapter RapZ [Ruminococcus sp.]